MSNQDERFLECFDERVVVFIMRILRHHAGGLRDRKSPFAQRFRSAKLQVLAVPPAIV